MSHTTQKTFCMCMCQMWMTDMEMMSALDVPEKGCFFVDRHDPDFRMCP